MKKSIFTFIILLYTNLVFGQFTDDFLDKKFTANTGWNGDIGNFDREGRVMKNILNNKMIGNSSNTTRQGTSEEGLQLNTGIYMVGMEAFSDNRNTNRFKEVSILNS